MCGKRKYYPKSNVLVSSHLVIDFNLVPWIVTLFPGTIRDSLITGDIAVAHARFKGKKKKKKNSKNGKKKKKRKEKAK